MANGEGAAPSDALGFDVKNAIGTSHRPGRVHRLVTYR